MNTQFRKNLPGTKLDFFDTQAAVDAIEPGAWDKLPYTSKVLAEQLVRRCEPAALTDSLKQLVYRERDLDFPWYPARVVCHDILGQTALVDLAGLRDAIADMGGDPAKVNPVVPVQLIVDHSLAVECGGFVPDAFVRNRAIEDRRNEDRFHFIEWTKKAFRNVDVIPPGNGILHQINLERMSPVVQVNDGVAYPDTLVGTDSHTPMVDALGVIAVGVGGLEAETVMLGRASWMRLPDIVGVELTGRPRPGITATMKDIATTMTTSSTHTDSMPGTRRCPSTVDAGSATSSSSARHSGSNLALGKRKSANSWVSAMRPTRSWCLTSRYFSLIWARVVSFGAG